MSSDTGAWSQRLRSRYVVQQRQSARVGSEQMYLLFRDTCQIFGGNEDFSDMGLSSDSGCSSYED
jgi:hypothetical protein